MRLRQIAGFICEPSIVAVMPPSSTRGASRVAQVMPWSAFETSIQRLTGSQFLQEPGSWSSSGRMVASGISISILPCATANGKANCTLSLDSLEAKLPWVPPWRDAD